MEEAAGAGIQFVTRCNSADEFIERFARFATETDIVVPAQPDVSAGSERHFAIRLKDGSDLMKGRCEVTEIRPVAVAPGAAPTPSGFALMRLRLREMDAHSCGIHLRLMERHASSPPEVEPRPGGPMAAAAPPPPASTTTELSAVTIVGDLPSPSDTETAATSPVPRPETRVPGTRFMVPANPLSDLDAADLASFVELTPLGSNGGVDAAPVASGDPSGGGAQADEEPTLVASPAPVARSGTRLAAARRLAHRVAPYASCVMVGLLFGIALRPGMKPAPAVCVPSPAPLPAIARPATAAAEIARPATAAAPEDEPSILVPRDCIARVTTKPRGAEVSWGDIAIGVSPIARAAIPCGRAIVTFRREHYAEATRTVTSERGRPTVVAQRLQRPHAFIRLNKQRLGRATREVAAR